MAEVYDVSAFDSKKFAPKAINLDELLSNLSSYSFNKILVDPSYTLARGDYSEKWHFSDEEHQVVVGDFVHFGKYLGFDGNYYEANKEKIDAIVIEICRSINKSSFSLSYPFITKEILKAISENPNIKTLYLGYDDDVYLLSKDDYEILKKSNIESIETTRISEELSEVFDDKLSYNVRRPLVLGSSYEQLCRSTSLWINRSLSDEEIKDIKYLNDSAKIVFKDFKDFANIFKVVKRIKDLGKGNSIKVVIQNSDNYDYKNDFNEYIFSHPELLDYDILIGVGISEEYSIKDYVKYEKRLIEMIKPAMNLSPLEKYLFAYNVAKKFKKYKENDDNKSESRNLYKIMDGEYMVCVGFANLLEDLLNKLGIKSASYSVTVDVTLDDVPDDALVIPDDVEYDSAGHARSLIHLTDPKYGIDGIFISDPTWDNSMEGDSYVHALMTPDEYNGLRRYNYLSFSNVKEMLFVHSLEEFYEKANIWMKKEENTILKRVNKSLEKGAEIFKEHLLEFMKDLESLDKESYDWFNKVYYNLASMRIPANNIGRFIDRMKTVVDRLNNQELSSKFSKVTKDYKDIKDSQDKARMARINAVLEFMKAMIKYFKDIDEQKYEELSEKYKDLKDSRFEPTIEYVQGFMLEVGEYVVNKVNKPVSGETLLTAIREMYDKTGDYTPEELDEKMADILEYNKVRQAESFPTRYQVLDDGTKIPVLNENNKFDIEIGLGK